MIWESFAGIMLAVFCAGMLTMWPFARKSCRDEAYDEGRADAYEEIRAVRPAPRGSHADGCACTLGGAPAALPPEMPPPRTVPVSAGGGRFVLLPAPGTYPPQPRRSTAPGTITFPKVELTVADTGEFRAVGDAMVAAIEAAGEAS